jgi:hypothetical protein
MCRLLNIACKQIINNLDDPLVMDTFMILLESYAKRTDTKMDDAIVEEIKKAMIHNKE